MVFGLPEDQEEEDIDRIRTVFEELGVKPTLQVCTVERGRRGDKNRPVKVSLACASNLYHILSRARKLCCSEKFSKVFLRPDRSEEERAVGKLLVQEITQRRKDDPNKHHYIRAGTVLTRDKKT